MLDTPTSQGIIVNLLKSQVRLALFIFPEVIGQNVSTLSVYSAFDILVYEL